MSAKTKRKKIVKPKVFDSWAILAFLEDEPAAEKVEAFIIESLEGEAPLLITTVNLGEVWYSITRSRSASEADLAIEQLNKLGLEVIPADWPLTQIAASFKAKYRLAYADCFAAALAKQRKTKVITGDKEFKQLEEEINVEWV